VTATTALPAWATNCSRKPNLISAECTCHWSGAAAPTTTAAVTTTRAVTTTAGGVVTTTSRAATTTAPPSSGSCSAPIDQLVGYGAGTTGGGSGTGVTVSSCSALTSALAAGGVIRISGQLNCGAVLDVESNTSIFGIGSTGGLINSGFRIKGATNVILRNLKFGVACSKCDIVNVDSSTKVWIDHNEFASKGIVGGKDDYDGLLDITHASDGVTVSWNILHDHWKGSLIGHSDSNSGEDTGKLHVTYHHNWFYNVNSRLPSLRFGTAHIYSSCYEDAPTSGVNSRMGAIARVENNSFNNVLLAMVTNLDSDTEGSIQDIGNLLLGTSTTRITKTGSLTPPYSYSADPASCVCARVKASAGVGKV
jgi:pectate lyase